MVVLIKAVKIMKIIAIFCGKAPYVLQTGPGKTNIMFELDFVI